MRKDWSRHGRVVASGAVAIFFVRTILTIRMTIADPRLQDAMIVLALELECIAALFFVTILFVKAIRTITESCKVKVSDKATSSNHDSLVSIAHPGLWKALALFRTASKFVVFASLGRFSAIDLVRAILMIK